MNPRVLVGEGEVLFDFFLQVLFSVSVEDMKIVNEILTAQQHCLSLVLLSEAHHQGFSPGTLVSSPPSSVNCFSQ